MRQAASVHDLFADLDRLIARSYEQDSPLGYFPIVYRFVVSHLRRSAQTGFLRDSARVDQIALGLFNRYYEALQQYEAGEPPARSWMVAFEGATDPATIVAQIIILGDIPHLNLDLPVVVARVNPGPTLEPFRDEFFTMNRLLAPLVDDVLDAVSQVSPLMGMLRGGLRRNTVGLAVDAIGGRAWALARRLAPLAPAEQLPLIASADAALAVEARLLLGSAPLLAAVRRLEPRSPRAVMDALLTLDGRGRPTEREPPHARHHHR